MDFSMINWIAWIGLFIGLAGRVFIPWLVERKNNPELGWDWRYVWPQLLSFGLIVLVLPLVIEDFNIINDLPFQLAWVAGWGAADAGRQVVKTFEQAPPEERA